MPRDSSSFTAAMAVGKVGADVQRTSCMVKRGITERLCGGLIRAAHDVPESGAGLCARTVSAESQGQVPRNARAAMAMKLAWCAGSSQRVTTTA